MKIPAEIKIVALVVGTCLFYSYVGHLVPQKEVLPPTEVIISADVTTDEMIAIGEEIAQGKGLCLTCHTLGESGSLRFPDLSGIGSLCTTRIPGKSGLEYLAQSLYEPDSYIVPGFNPGMPAIVRPPIGLTDDEILCVIAWLQSLGDEATVTLETRHSFNSDGVEAD
ncbi:MAG: cytochrome c [Acidobacteria bacterium]|nr:cytochrome c [Acidobacteriota bacterium]